MIAINISFILPMYNVEKYLAECVESILAQTGISKEIIIIDDGSTDNSATLAESYAEKYDFIRVVRQTNQGQSAARNVGIKMARGEYLWYIDPDDYIADDVAAKIYSLCYDNNLDVLKGQIATYDEVSKVFKLPKHQKDNANQDKVMSADDYFYAWVQGNDRTVSACMMVYRREFVLRNELNFAEGLIYEDVLYTLQVFSAEEKARVMEVPTAIYVYRINRPDSTMSKKDILFRFEKYMCIHNKMEKYLMKNKILKNQEKYAKKFIAYTFEFHFFAVYGLKKDRRLAWQVLTPKMIFEVSKALESRRRKYKLIRRYIKLCLFYRFF